MIYRFKVWFEEDEDIVRWIDVQSSNTFLDFHNCILDSIGFDKKEPASFYMSDDNWKKRLEVTLVDMGLEESDQAEPKPLMKDARMRDYVNDPHQRFVYVYDFIQMWTLYCELTQILEDEKGKTYPCIFRSLGKAPRQHEGASRFKIVDDAEFEELAARMIAGRKGDGPAAEEELLVDDEDEDDEDDLGFGDSDDYDEGELGGGFHEEEER
ncbi:MAG: hypothetical protein KJS92_07880 [Bacteroidetes bacterium]|nr:hypothetical protein [Bacteroidota bacterium]